MREENVERFSNYKGVSRADHFYLVYKYLNSDLENAVRTYAAGSVLDIGCGNKPYESMFAGKISKYTGCDIVQSSLKKVDVISDACNIPLEDGNFDTVFTTQTIEHIADHQGMLNEASRLLKAGGHIIVSGPMYWPLHEEPHDYFRFTRHGFTYILNKAGFEVVKIYSNGGKWALLGQACFHTLPSKILRFKFMRIIINRFFEMMDRRFLNEVNTMNYVVVAKKTA